MKDLYGNLEKHLHELCLMPSRHVGSPGAAAAADYIEKTFRSYGFTEVNRLPFPATGWRFGSMIFTDLDNSSAEVPGALPCFFSQSCDVTGVPLWLTEKELADLTPEKVKGRLCIIELIRGALDVRGRNGIAEDLDAMGAAAAVFIGTSHDTNSKLERSPALKKIGCATVGEAGSLYLSRNRNHRYTLKTDAGTFPHTACNVAAIRRGTGGKRAVFGSHFDAAPLSQGACDNASGVAVLLEAARLLKDEMPEWTFEFAGFDAEEYCLGTSQWPLGSENYVNGHPEKDWAFFMDFDCIGAHLSEELLYVGRGEKLPDFESIYPLKPIRNGGDERNFDRVGIPTLWFASCPRFQKFHTPADTIETLDISRICRCVSDAVKVTHQLCRP